MNRKKEFGMFVSIYYIKKKFCFHSGLVKTLSNRWTMCRGGDCIRQSITTRPGLNILIILRYKNSYCNNNHNCLLEIRDNVIQKHMIGVDNRPQSLDQRRDMDRER